MIAPCWGQLKLRCLWSNLCYKCDSQSARSPSILRSWNWDPHASYLPRCCAVQSVAWVSWGSCLHSILNSEPWSMQIAPLCKSREAHADPAGRVSDWKLNPQGGGYRRVLVALSIVCCGCEGFLGPWSKWSTVFLLSSWKFRGRCRLTWEHRPSEPQSMVADSQRPKTVRLQPKFPKIFAKSSGWCFYRYQICKIPAATDFALANVFLSCLRRLSVTLRDCYRLLHQ